MIYFCVIFFFRKWSWIEQHFFYAREENYAKMFGCLFTFIFIFIIMSGAAAGCCFWRCCCAQVPSINIEHDAMMRCNDPLIHSHLVWLSLCRTLPAGYISSVWCSMLYVHCICRYLCAFGVYVGYYVRGIAMMMLLFQCTRNNVLCRFYFVVVVAFCILLSLHFSLFVCSISCIAIVTVYTDWLSL